MNFKVTVLLAAAFSLIGSVYQSSASEKLTFCVEDKEEFPYLLNNGVELNSKLPGAAVELIRLAGKTIGIDIAIKRLPWKECLEQQLKDGAVDGAFPVSYKKEREALGQYPMKDGKLDSKFSCSTQTYVFYKKEGSPIHWDGRDVTGPKGVVGVTSGASVITKLNALGLSVQEGTEVENFRQLASGKISLIAVKDMDAERMFSTIPGLAANVEKIETPIETKPYFLVFSQQFMNKNPGQAQKLWDAIIEVKKSDYIKIVAKYFSN